MCVELACESRRCGVLRAAIRRPGQDAVAVLLHNGGWVRTESEDGVLYGSETRAEWYMYSTQRAMVKQKQAREER